MREIVNIFLPISLDIRFGSSKEQSHGDGYLSIHNFCFGVEIKNIFNYILVSGGLDEADYILTKYL